jgi:hypothetical protein
LKKDVTALQGQVDLLKREVELKDGEISRQAALLTTFSQAMAQKQAGSISGQAQLTELRLRATNGVDADNRRRIDSASCNLTIAAGHLCS